MSLRELIAKANDRKTEPIDVPEWPGTVGQLFVRSISAREQMECVKRFGPDSGMAKKPDEYWPELAAFFLCDTEGVRIFTHEEAAEMADRNVDVLMRIVAAGMKHNGMSVDEDAVKNSRANAVLRFAYRLALVFGEPDVDAVLDAPAAWFNGWRNYYEVDPWGGERGDLQAAYVGAASMAPWTKNPSAPRLAMFLPSFAGAHRVEQPLAEQKAIFAQGKRAFEKRIAQDKARHG